MNKRVLRVVLPILIIAVIGAIWGVKNFTRIEEPQINQSEANKDFLLNATSIDLEQLKSYGIPIMIDFGADSCVPCKEMAPVLKKLNKELQGKAIVKFVDVWKNQNAADGFPVEVITNDILSMPALVIDEKVVSCGRVLKPKEIVKLFS